MKQVIKIHSKTKKYTLLTLTVFVASMMLLQGCVQSSGTVTPAEKTVLQSIGKRNQIDNYKSQGNLELSINTAQGERKSQGSVDIYVSGEKKRTDTEISIANQTTESRLYDLGNKTYSCSKIVNWTCQEAETGAIGSMGMAETGKLKKLINEGKITFAKETVQEKEINGRKCSYVVMDIDPDALLSRSQFKGQISSLKMGQCFDKETGIPIYSNTNLGVSMYGQSASMEIEMKISSLETGTDINEDKFSLPA